MTNPDTGLDDIIYCTTSCATNADPADGGGWCTCGAEETKTKLHQWSAKRDTPYKDNLTYISRSRIPGSWQHPVTGNKLYNEAAVAKRELEARVDELTEQLIGFETALEVVNSQRFTNVIEPIITASKNRIAALNKELEDL